MGAHLQALGPLVLSVSQSCFQLCSSMKTDYNYPCLLPKNTLFPGKWSWDGKGEHGTAPCCTADW